MGFESASFIAQLNANNPVGATDTKAEGDDHLRLIKSVLQNTFPGRYSAEFTVVHHNVSAVAGVADKGKVWIADNPILTFTVNPATVGPYFVLFAQNASGNALYISNGATIITTVWPKGGIILVSDGTTLTPFPTPSPFQSLVAKATIDGTTTGAPAILSGFGISSCVRNTTGDYTINFSPTLTTTLYTPLLSCSASSVGSIPMFVCINQNRAFSGATFSVLARDHNSTARDVLRLYVAIPGD